MSNTEHRYLLLQERSKILSNDVSQAVSELEFRINKIRQLEEQISLKNSNIEDLEDTLKESLKLNKNLMNLLK
jgi:hypothetical protein